MKGATARRRPSGGRRRHRSSPGQYRHEVQRDGRSPAVTRRQSRARCLPFTLRAPGSESPRHLPVRHDTPAIKFVEASLNLIQLPSLRFHIGGNGFSREKRFGATCAPCERLELS
jgi:hypothetical protein